MTFKNKKNILKIIFTCLQIVCYVTIIRWLFSVAKILGFEWFGVFGFICILFLFFKLVWEITFQWYNNSLMKLKGD